MMELIQTLLALDWAGIGAGVLMIYGGLKAIAAITPWTGDDKLLEVITVPLKKLGILK